MNFSRRDSLKRLLDTLPEKPGVYLFKDRDGKPIYIGKALSLKKRVRDHFRHCHETHSKEGVMLSFVSRVDTVETPSEAEALLLEASLVKEMLPKYNKMLRDDKSYPYLKITDEPWPRLLMVRTRKADGGKYFGPYTDVRLLHQAVKMLRMEFPLRTCRKMPKKVCLMYHLGQCGGPCEDFQGAASYAETIKNLQRFLEGRRDAMVRSLSKRMKEHSLRHEYEKAKAMHDAMLALGSMQLPARPRATTMEILKDFQTIFSLPKAPHRIECFDISNIQGHEPVGSMIVFMDGEPARNQYRRYHVRSVPGIDDYRMMREVVRRRYEKALKEQSLLPDLVLIDGGKGHLAAAKTELDLLGLQALPLLSIAKEHEILFAPGRTAPHVLPPTSAVLQILRHARDEAHRFAITFHRRLHRRQALVSGLNRIRGLGPKTREKLFKKIGSVAKIRKVAEEELVKRAGISMNLARAIKKELGEK